MESSGQQAKRISALRLTQNFEQPPLVIATS